MLPAALTPGRAGSCLLLWPQSLGPRGLIRRAWEEVAPEGLLPQCWRRGGRARGTEVLGAAKGDVLGTKVTASSLLPGQRGPGPGDLLDPLPQRTLERRAFLTCPSPARASPSRGCFSPAAPFPARDHVPPRLCQAAAGSPPPPGRRQEPCHPQSHPVLRDLRGLKADSTGLSADSSWRPADVGASLLPTPH